LLRQSDQSVMPINQQRVGLAALINRKDSGAPCAEAQFPPAGLGAGSAAATGFTVSAGAGAGVGAGVGAMGRILV
jgi:hypothetical protein